MEVSQKTIFKVFELFRLEKFVEVKGKVFYISTLKVMSWF